MQTVRQPTYGSSSHYLGEKGKEYFAWQSGGGVFGARINAHKFRHHIRPEDTVLDFGCGGGFLLKHLNCARRIRVEINPVAREHAASLRGPGYAGGSELPDQVADAVLSAHPTVHLPSPLVAVLALH